MDAADRSALLNLKVERAKKHIVDLEDEIHSFLASNPYQVVEKIDPASGKYRYEIGAIAPVPASVSLIFGDAIHNLRSALDHLCIQLLSVQQSIGLSSDPFPFPTPNTHKSYLDFFRGKKPVRLRADAWAALRSLEAYKGGKRHDLWVLNRLNNIDKHRLVLAVGSAHTAVNLGASMLRHLQREIRASGSQTIDADAIEIFDVFYGVADTQCPLEVGDVLASGLTGAGEMNADEFRFDVALNEPDVIHSQPIIPIAKHFAEIVSTVMDQFAPCLL